MRAGKRGNRRAGIRQARFIDFDERFEEGGRGEGKSAYFVGIYQPHALLDSGNKGEGLHSYLDFFARGIINHHSSLSLLSL